MLPETFIIDSGKVLTRFGKWPHFQDMEVISLYMERRGRTAPWVEFVVLVWDYTGRIAPEGHYEQTKHSLVRFRCEGVTSNHFDDFNHQNVLDGLEFSRTTGKSNGVGVLFSSIYGLGGTLQCEFVRVVDVIPAISQGLPQEE